MRSLVLLAFLVMALASCGKNDPEVAGPLLPIETVPITPTNDPALMKAADIVQPLLEKEFASTYAGLEVRNELPTLVVYRKPDLMLDNEVRKAVDVRIEFRDARYTRIEMTEHVQRVMDDTKYWKGHGARIVSAGPAVDGSGVRVGVVEAPGDFARQLEEWYPAMSFDVEKSGEIVPAPYTGPPPVFSATK